MVSEKLPQAEVLLELQELDSGIRNLGKETNHGKKRISKKRDKKLIVLTRERETKVKEVDKVLLDRYEQLRNTMRNGVAVVSVDRGVCQGCHLALSTTELQSLETADSVQFCDYCGRMLVCPRARSRAK